MGQTIRSFVSGRILPKFSVPQGMDGATLAALYDGGLNELKNDSLVHELWSDSDHSLIMYPKTIPSLPYEVLVTLLPKYDKNKIYKTVRSLPLESLLHVANSMRATLMATRAIALEDGNTPQYGYIFQHVGPRDTSPKAAFNTSYLPLHFHIQVYGYELSNFALFRESEPIDLSTPEYASLTFDPAFMIAEDMLESAGYAVRRRGNTALEFNKRSAEDPFTRLEMQGIREMQITWMRNWDNLAACFTDFRKDNYGRYLLYDKRIRAINIEAYLSHAQYTLRNNTKDALRALARSLEDNTPDPWQWTYMGVNGTAGYAFDFKNNTRSFIFSPKIFTNSYRHFDVVEQDFIIVKEKNSNDLAPSVATEEILDIQRRIISMLLTLPRG